MPPTRQDKTVLSCQCRRCELGISQSLESEPVNSEYYQLLNTADEQNQYELRTGHYGCEDFTESQCGTAQSMQCLWCKLTYVNSILTLILQFCSKKFQNSASFNLDLPQFIF